jgi:hypothetical protein
MNNAHPVQQKLLLARKGYISNPIGAICAQGIMKADICFEFD